jgi:hypothetical protein
MIEATHALLDSIKCSFYSQHERQPICGLIAVVVALVPVASVVGDATGKAFAGVTELVD